MPQAPGLYDCEFDTTIVSLVNVTYCFCVISKAIKYETARCSGSAPASHADQAHRPTDCEFNTTIVSLVNVTFSLVSILRQLHVEDMFFICHKAALDQALGPNYCEFDTTIVSLLNVTCCFCVIFKAISYRRHSTKAALDQSSPPQGR